jgi:excisionase family DNA binding protein
MTEKLLTVEEVAQYLGLSREAVKELVENGELPAYKIGGSFLRFKKEQIETYCRIRDSSSMTKKALFRDRGVKSNLLERKPEDITRYTFWERLEDFLYYNDFYILSLILLALIVLAVFEF